MTQKIKGQRLTVCFVEDDGAENEWNELPSWMEAIGHLSVKPGQVEKVYAQMFAKFKRLSNGERLRNPDHFNTEGDLPNGKHFYAVKTGKIRAYGWYSDRHKGVFVVSHFIYKQGEKLSNADKKRVQNNWKRIERVEA